MAREFAKEEELCFLCGHYEGVDERVLEEIVTDFISIGDYVLTGGELPAAVMIDAIARMVPGVLKMKNREKWNPSAKTCWSTRSTPGPRSGWDVRCPGYFCPGIMRKWMPGGGNVPWNGRRNGVRICMSDTICPAGPWNT